MAKTVTNIITLVAVPNAEDRKLKYVRSEFDSDVYQVIEFGWETGELVAVTPEATKDEIVASYRSAYPEA
jgi:hypothetical protein